MKKRTIFGVLLVFLLALTLSTSVAFAGDDDDDDTPPDLVRLVVDNRTDEIIYLTLEGEENFFLTIEAGTEKTFTVPPDDYNHTTYACGETVTGVVDLNRKLELVFSPCYVNPVNLGEPSIEKIFMGDDDEVNSNWQFQLD